ncbi:MAG: SRPBCC family protein [Mycobacteriaceae bacterium]|nr:SRPBCC family protein [Mycobacteriaceae bacterium]
MNLPQPIGAEVNIDADADTVYELITDLPTLASLSDEIATMEWRKESSVKPGAVFTGHNRNGARKWSTTCTVTDADSGRVFAFDVRHTVLPIAHWRYDIQPLDGGGCRVTERTWDRRPRWFKQVAGLATGVKDRAAANTAHINSTLQRLKKAAETKETPPPTS